MDSIPKARTKTSRTNSVGVLLPPLHTGWNPHGQKRRFVPLNLYNLSLDSSHSDDYYSCLQRIVWDTDIVPLESQFDICLQERKGFFLLRIACQQRGNQRWLAAPLLPRVPGQL
jgi:hypothetical protein